MLDHLCLGKPAFSLSFWAYYEASGNQNTVLGPPVANPLGCFPREIFKVQMSLSLKSKALLILLGQPSILGEVEP